jgi:hypothetical protein
MDYFTPERSHMPTGMPFAGKTTLYKAMLERSDLKQFPRFAGYCQQRYMLKN